MEEFPRVRWLALLLVIAFAVLLFGVNFNLAAALGNLGLKAAGIAAGLLAAAKIIEEAMRSIDSTDPMMDGDEYHTMGRGVVGLPPFWRRVL